MGSNETLNMARLTACTTCYCDFDHCVRLWNRLKVIGECADTFPEVEEVLPIYIRKKMTPRAVCQ